MTSTILSFLKRKLRTKFLSFENGPCSCDFCLMARSMIQKDSKLALKLKAFTAGSAHNYSQCTRVADKMKSCKFSYLRDKDDINWSKIPGTSSCTASEYQDTPSINEKMQQQKYKPENYDEVLRKLMFVEAEHQKSRRLLKKKSKEQFDGVMNGIQVSQRVIDEIERLDTKRKELRRKASNLRQQIRIIRKQPSLQSIQNQTSYKSYTAL